MKKFKVNNFTITHSTLVLSILGIVLFVASIGTATVCIYSHKLANQKVTLINDSEESEVSLDKISTNKLVLPSINNEESLPKKEESKKVEEVSIQKFCAPLPKEYMLYQTSQQGLRDVISANEAGGHSTSGKYHNGIDFKCPDKTPVYATKDGYVIEVWPSYYNGGYNYPGHPTYGGLVIIKHLDNTISLYAHLSFTDVKEGDYVTAGKKIAWSGGVKGRRGSGISTGPHLHYSIYLDMESFLEY